MVDKSFGKAALIKHQGTSVNPRHIKDETAADFVREMLASTKYDIKSVILIYIYT